MITQIKKIVDEFIKILIMLYLIMIAYTTRHSPILISLISVLSKANISDLSIRILYININILLPISKKKIV